jgi:hypothetical protein
LNRVTALLRERKSVKVRQNFPGGKHQFWGTLKLTLSFDFPSQVQVHSCFRLILYSHKIQLNI